MSSNSLESQGMLFQIGDAASPEVFTSIAEVTSISGPGGSAAVIDTTDLNSTAKEKRMGLSDEGQVTLDIMYIPANTQHALLRTRRASRVLTNFKIIFTDSPATTWSFSGYVLGFTVNNAVDATTNASVTIEVSGSITES